MTTDRSGDREPMGARWLITPVTRPNERAAPNVEVGPLGSRAPLQQKIGPRGANLEQLSPEITRTFPNIVETWRQEGGPTPVITSGNDGRHKQGSRRYSNEAIDLRCNNLPDEHCQRISDALSRSLGSDYDVQFERFSDPSSDHIHLEYDPKPHSRSDSKPRASATGDELDIRDWMGWRNGAMGLT